MQESWVLSSRDEDWVTLMCVCFSYLLCTCLSSLKWLDSSSTFDSQFVRQSHSLSFHCLLLQHACRYTTCSKTLSRLSLSPSWEEWLRRETKGRKTVFYMLCCRFEIIILTRDLFLKVRVIISWSASSTCMYWIEHDVLWCVVGFERVSVMQVWVLLLSLSSQLDPLQDFLGRTSHDDIEVSVSQVVSVFLRVLSLAFFFREFVSSISFAFVVGLRRLFLASRMRNELSDYNMTTVFTQRHDEPPAKTNWERAAKLTFVYQFVI